MNVRDKAIRIPTGEFRYAIIDYLDTDYSARIKTFSEARSSKIFASEDSAIQYVRALPDKLSEELRHNFDSSTRDSQIRIIELLNEQKMDIVPSASDALPESIPRIEPPENNEECDHNIQVAGNIIFDTLGISLGDTSLITSFIKSDPDLEEKITKLVYAISTKEWEDVVKWAEIIFKAIIGSKVWSKFSKKTKRKITFKFALRAVPIVGWIYTGAAFVVAVKANLDRFCFK